MRLRRLELVVITLTLAFICFIGGFFTGRSFSAISIDSVTAVAVEPVENQNPETVRADPVLGDAAMPDNNTGAQTGEQSQAMPADASPGAPRGDDGKININTASKNELMDLPGIGPAIADRIIEYRHQHGGFAAIEDIMKVSGIAEGRFSRIKDRITI